MYINAIPILRQPLFDNWHVFFSYTKNQNYNEEILLFFQNMYMVIPVSTQGLKSLPAGWYVADKEIYGMGRFKK